MDTYIGLLMLKLPYKVLLVKFSLQQIGNRKVTSVLPISALVAEKFGPQDKIKEYIKGLAQNGKRDRELL